MGMNIELKIDEKQVAEAIIADLKRHNLMNEAQNVTMIYNAADNSGEVLYTVAEVAKMLKTNPAYVYELIKAGQLPVLKLGSMKIRRVALLTFLERCEGFDLTNPHEVKRLDMGDI
ncbi:MAG: helix-turn-helix domain-containing protein [Negativicutes bacterium]|jgi:excisionase family DNA binding protein